MLDLIWYVCLPWAIFMINQRFFCHVILYTSMFTSQSFGWTSHLYFFRKIKMFKHLVSSSLCSALKVSERQDGRWILTYDLFAKALSFVMSTILRALPLNISSVDTFLFRPLDRWTAHAEGVAARCTFRPGFV